MLKIIGIILFILYETFDLFYHGIVDPLAFGMLKIIFLNMLLLLVLFFKNNIFQNEGKNTTNKKNSIKNITNTNENSWKK